MDIVGTQTAFLNRAIVHVLSLDGDRTAVSFRLSGTLQRCVRKIIRTASCSVALATQLDVDRATVRDKQCVSACCGIPTVRERGLRCIGGNGSRKLFRTNGIGIVWFRCRALDDNLVGYRCDGVGAVVVEIKVDVVSILPDSGSGEHAPGELQFLASVVLQGNRCRGRPLTIKIGVRRVGDQLVAVAVDIEVARAHFRILRIKVLELGALAGPFGRFLYLHRNGLGRVVMEFGHDRNGTISACLLEPSKVVHPASVVLVQRVVLLIQSVVEIFPPDIFVFVAAGGDIIDHYNLGLVNHFLPCGNIERAVDDLAEHIHPHILEAGEAAPVTMRVALDRRIAEIFEVFGPDELRPIPYGPAIDTALLHNCGESCRHGILLAVVLAQHHVEGSVPSTVVVAYAIVVGKSCDIGSPRDAFGVIEA